MLGVAKKLVKMQFTHLKEKIEKNLFFFSQAAQTTNDQFLVLRYFRG
jgi:hypothetical protein